MPLPGIGACQSGRVLHSRGMNVHHLELFYYVARHGGVSAAARHIPYGIQQPAVSAQIIQLEDSLGTTLFHRRPFSLTKSGTDLYAHLRPFFEGLPEVTARLRGNQPVHLRIGAPETVQRDYMPRILKRLKRRFPRMRFTLATGRADWMEKALLDQEIDIGLGSLIGKRMTGVRQEELLQVGMSLLVPEKSGYTKAASFWERDRIDLPPFSLRHEGFPFPDPKHRFPRGRPVPFADLREQTREQHGIQTMSLLLHERFEFNEKIVTTGLRDITRPHRQHPVVRPEAE